MSVSDPSFLDRGAESQREYESRLVALRALILDAVVMDSHLDRIQALDFGWGAQ